MNNWDKVIAELGEPDPRINTSAKQPQTWWWDGGEVAAARINKGFRPMDGPLTVRAYVIIGTETATLESYPVATYDAAVELIPRLLLLAKDAAERAAAEVAK